MKTSTIKRGSKIFTTLGILVFLSLNTKAQGNSSFTGNTMPVLSASNTAGGFNCMLNMRTLSPTGQNNSAFGVRALELNIAGNNNSAFGLFAARVTTGGDDCAFGVDALGSNTSGNGNTGLGTSAMNVNTTGSGNTCVGRGANVGSASLSNASAFGASAISNASNKIRIGDANVTEIEGQVAYTSVSDGRFKSNITEADVKGLEFIKILRPVVYNFETRRFQEFLTKNMSEEQKAVYFSQDFTASTNIRHSGFIAQEVEKAALEVGYDFDGVHKPKSENENYSLAYSQFVVPLVKAVQEQQKMIESQAKDIAELKQQLSVSTGLNEVKGADGFELYQNIPNPFTSETNIKYTLPGQFNKAQMTIYDLSGKQVASYGLEPRSSSITLTAQKLSAGIYIYTILVDGKALDSKRMIVAEKD